MLNKINEKLKKYIKQLQTIEDISEEIHYSSMFNKCKELKNRIKSFEFHVVVIGQYKRGKSTLLNYFLGEDLLPTGIVPITSIITKLRYGDTPKANVVFQNKTQKTIDIKSISQYISEQENSENVKNVDNIEVIYPSELLKKGLVLIDTPGIGSVYKHNTQAAYDYLSEADAAIFIISADAPIGEVDIEFLVQAKKYIDKIFFIQNKTDYLNDEEKKESLLFSSEAIYKAINNKPNIYPISAKLAYEGKIEGSLDKISDSGIKAFESALNNFLISHKEEYLVKNYENKILSVVENVKQYIDFNIDILSSSVEDLEKKVEIFQLKLNSVNSMKKEALAVIEAELNSIIKFFEDELHIFRKKQEQIIEDKLKSIASDNESNRPKNLYHLLNNCLEKEIETAYTTWNKEQEMIIKNSYESVISRFTDELNNIIEQMNSITYSLFKINIGKPIQKFELIDRDTFYFKFKRESSAYLNPDTKEILFFLPRRLSNKKILKDVLKRVEKELETNGNNLKWDYMCKIRDSKYTFEHAFDHYIYCIRQDLDTFIERAKALKEKESNNVNKILDFYSEKRKIIDSLDQTLKNN